MAYKRKCVKDPGLLLMCVLIFALVTPGRAWAARFFMERPKLGLGISYEFRSETITGPDTRTDNTSQELRPVLDVRTRGWVYHPAFMRYKLGFQPALSWHEESGNIATGSDLNPFLPAYFADFTFLPVKPYTLHLYGKRYDDVVTSAFAAQTETTTESYGGDLYLKYRVLPTTFSYSRTRIDQTGFFDSGEDRDDFRITTRHQKGRSDTQAYTIYSDSDRVSNGIPTRVKTSNSEIRNFFDFTGKRQIMLNSFLTYRWSQQNDLDTSGLRWLEQLNWRHRKNFWSNYRLGCNRQTSGDFDRRTIFANAGLEHLLYENLTTRLNGGGEWSDFTGGGEDVYNADLDFQYRRPIPWGWLNLHAGWTDTATFRRGGGRVPVQVVDEPHVLSTGVVTFLDHNNVDAGSVVVTNVAGSVVYVENIDYTVTHVDYSVQISRTIVGDIADGQTVLVSYRYLSDSDFNDNIFGQTYGIDFLLWSSLRLYYSYSRARQQILSGTVLTANRVNDSRHRAEVRYDLGWTDTQLTFDDTRRESGASTRAWRAKQTFVVRPFRRMYFRLSGYYGQTAFDDRDDTQQLHGVRTDLTLALTRWSRLRMEAYRDTITGAGQDTVNTVFTASVDLSYRIWRGTIFYQYTDMDNPFVDQRRTTHNLFVEIIRLRW